MSLQPVPGAPAQVTQPWLARLVSTVNALVGKANCAASLTLAAGAATTTMTDTRLSAVSVLAFMPTTATAATAHGTIYVTGQKQGEAVIHHANTADTDKIFRVAIHG